MSQDVAQVRDCFQQSFLPELEVSLDKLFQSVDESVLKLACDASENKEQNRFFEAAQALRIVRSEIKAIFIQLLSDYSFHLNVDAQHLQSLLGLVNVSIDEQPRKNAGANLEARLQSVSLDLHNPFTAENFITCFLRSLANTDFDIHIKMLVLRLFEAQTFTKLGQFVDLANSALLDLQVLPDLVERSDIQDSVDDIIDAALGTHQTDANEESLLESALADLQADEYELLDLHLTPDFLFDVSLPVVRDFVAELSSASDFSAADIENVEVVKQLFLILLESDALAVPVRFLLSKLQLPYARIALVEKNFLNSHGHPARTLLSQLADLSLMWSIDDPESLQKDGLFLQFKNIIQTLYETERMQQVLCADLLFSLIAFAEEQRQHSLIVAHQWQQSANAGVSSDQCREHVDQLLMQKTQGLTLPAAVSRILNDGWAHVLYVQAVAHGFDSESWQSAVAVVDDLLASVKAVESYKSREDFLAQLPALLHALRIGLYVIDLSSTLIHQFLADLEIVHKAMIVKIVDSGQLADYDGSALSQNECPSALPVIQALNDAAELQELERQQEIQRQQELESQQEIERQKALEQQEQESLRQSELAARAEDESAAEKKQLLSVLGQGVWVIWHKSESTERCQIAAHIKHTQKYILTNRSGRKIAEVVESDMVNLLASGEIELAESGHVFEKALESVIGGIRENR